MQWAVLYTLVLQNYNSFELQNVIFVALKAANNIWHQFYN